MRDFVNKCIKWYDILLNVVFVLLVIWTGFVICYYTLPEQTSEIIAKAFSYAENTEVARKFMDFLSVSTLGAGFPLWFSQKAMISRYINNDQNKQGYKSTQDILSENLKLLESQVEFQKAEAIRFANSPTMPAKARLQYKKFLDSLEERSEHIEALQDKLVTKANKVKASAESKGKRIKKKVKETEDKLDSLV